MQIIYTHGFNSGPSTGSGKKLREAFPDLPLTVLTYDSAWDFNRIFAKLVNEAAAILKNGPAVLAGSSLGGYYTARLADSFNLPCVLVNPCNDPQASLAQFLGENHSFEDNHAWQFTQDVLESYEPLNPAQLAPAERLVIIGKNDEVLDPAANMVFWKDYARLASSEDGHSVASFAPFKTEMRKIFAAAEKAWQGA